MIRVYKPEPSKEIFRSEKEITLNDFEKMDLPNKLSLPEKLEFKNQPGYWLWNKKKNKEIK